MRSCTVRAIGRLGQMLGLTVPALAVVMELSGRITSGPMLGMLVFSVCCFAIGRILEGYAGS
jgi:hypothetical protein